MQESGLTEVIPFTCTSAVWGHCPLFSPLSSSGLTVGSGCSLMANIGQVFFPSWVPSGATSSPSTVAAITDDCDNLCLLIWHEIFHFSLSWELREWSHLALQEECPLERRPFLQWPQRKNKLGSCEDSEDPWLMVRRVEADEIRAGEGVG